MNICNGSVVYMKFAINSGPTRIIGNMTVINIIIINIILKMIISLFIFNGKTPTTALC